MRARTVYFKAELLLMILMIGFNIETLNAAGCVCSFTIQSNSLAIVDASFGLEQYLSISCDIPLSPMAFSLDKLLSIACIHLFLLVSQIVVD